jgi:hypothetical protein
LSDQPGNALQAALDSVLRDFGLDICDDPRRLRAVLTDVLGEDGRSYHADVDAIVKAAELGIPRALVGNADRGALINQLAATGVTPATAGLAIGTWNLAVKPDRAPPTVTAPGVPPPSTDADRRPRRGGQASPTVLPPDPRSAPPATSGAPRRTRVLLGAAAVTLVLLVIGAVLASGGSNGKAEVASGDSTASTTSTAGMGTEVGETTTTQPATTTTQPPTTTTQRATTASTQRSTTTMTQPPTTTTTQRSTTTTAQPPTTTTTQAPTTTTTTPPPPVANHDRYGNMASGVQYKLPVLANDTGTGIRISGVSIPSPAGSSATSDGSFVYYTAGPAGCSGGYDIFTYVVTDSAGRTSSATVTPDSIGC